MSPVCVDIDSMTNAGTTKKITSHSQAGSASQYGVSRAAMRRRLIRGSRCPTSRLVDRLEDRVPGALLGRREHAVAVQPGVVLAGREDQRAGDQTLQVGLVIALRRCRILLDDRLGAGHWG